jgi:hypothetical protein
MDVCKNSFESRFRRYRLIKRLVPVGKHGCKEMVCTLTKISFAKKSVSDHLLFCNSTTLSFATFVAETKTKLQATADY